MFFLRKLIIKLSNLKFAIFLMLSIAFASALGTFIPQDRISTDYINIYNKEPFLKILNGDKILFLELDHIYTSSWFLTLLILLCISLAACSFRTQIPSLKASLKWVDYDKEKKFMRLELANNWQISNKEELISHSSKVLENNGWESLNYGNRISARKGVAGKLGPIIVHIGLLILLIGSAYGNFTRQSKEQYLTNNEELDLINDSSNEKFTIKLKEFSIVRENDGKPKQFISTLDFKTNKSDIIEEKIAKVNHPIRYQGLTIYQADWSIPNIILEIDDLKYQLQLKPIPEFGEQIWGILIEIGEKNKRNYLLTIDNEIGPVKVFNSTTFEEEDLYVDGKVSFINESKLKLLKINTSSGLIIKNDPSIPFIYASFVFIIIGIILSVVPTKQLWILINENTAKFYIGGLSNRNLSGFKIEFESLTEQIKNF